MSDNTGLHDRDILVRVDDKVDKLSLDMAVVKASAEVTSKMLTDHESRLRALEKFRWGWPSISFVAAAAAVSTALLYAFH